MTFSSSKTLSDALGADVSALKVLGSAENDVKPGGPVPGTAAATTEVGHGTPAEDAEAVVAALAAVVVLDMSSVVGTDETEVEVVEAIEAVLVTVDDDKRRRPDRTPSLEARLTCAITVT